MPSEIIGKRFGKLIVESEVEAVRYGVSQKLQRRFACVCDCGNRSIVFLANLRRKDRPTTSCGCLRKQPPPNKTHGLTKTREFKIWMGMLKRCENPKHPFYDKYGGAGIVVCERWHQFENFVADMGMAPSPKHELDRFPKQAGNYEPGNVRWATRKENCRNRKSNVMLMFNGKTQHITDWAAELGIDRRTLRERLNRGWPVEQVLGTPVAVTKPKKPNFEL